MPRVTAIIPAYNEEKTIADVVRPLKASPLIGEVIVISDGSTDRTKVLAEAAGAMVHELPKRSGKGAAMLHGLTHTDAPVVLFVDADLLGLNEDHIERLVMPVLSGSRSMNVGLRDRGRLVTRWSKHLPLVGGERALHRSIIENVPPRYIQGFMVETALNYYCRSRGLPYGTVFLPGLSIRRKMQKVGFGRGLVQYVKMWGQVARAMVVVRVARMFRRF